MLKSILKSRFAFLCATFILSNSLNLIAIFVATLYFSNQIIAAFGIWIASSILLSLLLTWRLEQQLVGAKRRDALNILSSALALATIASLIVLVVLFLAPLDPFWLLLAPAGWLRALRSIADIWVIRVRMVKTNAALACFEASVRLGLVLLACMLDWTTIWVLLVADLLAMTGYLAVLIAIIPKPKAPLLSRLHWTRSIRDLSAATLKNATLNLGSAFSETALVNLPLFLSALFLTPAQTAGVYIVHKLAESVRRLVSFSISVTLFRRFAALRTAPPSIQVMNYRRGLAASFVFSALQFAVIYFLLYALRAYLPGAWQEALVQFPLLLPFFFFFAAIAPALRLFTVRNRENLSFLCNIMSIAVAMLGIALAYASDAPGWVFCMALALAALIRAGLIVWLQIRLFQSTR